MGNPQYIKGRKKEYKIVKDLKADGYDIAQRSAGSHSPIDIFSVCRKTMRITFVQGKPDGFDSSKIEEEYAWLNGKFDVDFKVI